MQGGAGSRAGLVGKAAVGDAGGDFRAGGDKVLRNDCVD